MVEALACRIIVLESILLELCDHLGTEEVRQRIQGLGQFDNVVQICFSEYNNNPVTCLSVIFSRSSRGSQTTVSVASPLGQLSMIDIQKHYVPVLKVKRGEKRALREIQTGLRHRITPLLEIVELTNLAKKTLNQHLDTTFKDLADSVQSYSRCFLDCRELQPDWPLASEEVFSPGDSGKHGLHACYRNLQKQ